MAVTPLNTLFNWFKNGSKPPDMQFWAWMTSFWHKDELIPSASISGLQNLLDAKVDKKDLIQNKGVFDPAKAYVFSAELAEYVSFVNEASADDFYRVERWFRLLADTIAGESPETAPAKWKHIGTVLGEIAIEDVVGLREELDALTQGGTGTGLTPEQAEVLTEAEAHMDGADEGKHTTHQIIEQAANILLGLPENSKLNAVIAAITSFLQGTINTNAINDPSWQISESRLALLYKMDANTINLQGSVLLVDVFAPTSVKPLLENKSGWVNDTKTLTGENFLGELGKSGQRLMLSDGTFCSCEDSIKGTSGGANGSATYKRNISANILTPDSNTQDASICNLLDPSRTGGGIDDGWDLTTQTKIIALPTRLDARWKAPGSYNYWCYLIDGSNSYWTRTGSPIVRYRAINSITHPTLTSRLAAHDFTTGWYTTQSGDEATVPDQTWTDETNQQYYIKVSSTKWKKV